MINYDYFRKMYGKDIIIIDLNVEQDLATIVDEDNNIYYNVPPEFVWMTQQLYKSPPNDIGWIYGHLN